MRQYLAARMIPVVPGASAGRGRCEAYTFKHPAIAGCFISLITSLLAYKAIRCLALSLLFNAQECVE